MPTDETLSIKERLATTMAGLASVEHKPRFRTLANGWRRLLIRIRDRLDRQIGRRTMDNDWPDGLAALALAAAVRQGIAPATDTGLRDFFERRIDARGGWRQPPTRPSACMSGYGLLVLADRESDPRYRIALDQLADFLLHGMPRLLDGSIPYLRHLNLALVDTLGMICPFLAGYGRRFDCPPASALSVHLLQRFIDDAVDHETGLPYHGYRPGSASRLGPHGWGRGTGWYLIGLVDTLLELDETAVNRDRLATALRTAAASLVRLQRPDGHWGWMVPMPEGCPDTSVAAFCGYALARGRREGLLDASVDPAIRLAWSGLVTALRDDGALNGASGECFGVGHYSMIFGPQIWAGSAANAFGCTLVGLDGKDMEPAAV